MARDQDHRLRRYDGELFNNDELAEAFGVPAGGTKPKVRIVAHIRTGSRRWIGAAVAGYHDGENTLVDDLAGTLREGMLNLADRGFFSMDRWIRFSATGAHLCWRAKNGAKSVPFKTLKTLPDGSELVLLHESDGMLTKRRRDIADRSTPPARHDRPAGPVHHRDPHRQRPRQDLRHPAADHPAGPRRLPRRGSPRCMPSAGRWKPPTFI